MNTSDFIKPFFILLALFALLVRIAWLRGLLTKNWTGMPTDWGFVFVLCCAVLVCLDATGFQGVFGTVSMCVLLLFLARLMARAYEADQIETTREREHTQ